MAFRAARTRSRSRAGSRPTFILTEEKPWSAQCPSCSASSDSETGGKPPAPVRGPPPPYHAQQARERQVEHLCLQVPDRHVERGDGHGAGAAAAVVANRPTRFRVDAP